MSTAWDHRRVPEDGTWGVPACWRQVLVAVSGLDRRAESALQVATLIPAAGLTAVHVAVDPDVTERVGLEWMEAEPEVALLVLDDEGGVAATLAAEAQRRLADGAAEVVVLVGELTMSGWSRRLFHDRTARSIARHLGAIAGVRSVVVPVAVA